MSAWSTIAELRQPGDSIRERRIELGWTQAELAERAGVSQADISRLENGRLDARWSTMRRLSAALASPATDPRRSLADGSALDPAMGAAWDVDSDTAGLQDGPIVEDVRGVDVGQIRQQLRMCVAERVRVMVEAANTMLTVQEAAQTSLRQRTQ